MSGHGSKNWTRELESLKMSKTSATNVVGPQNVYDTIIWADIKLRSEDWPTDETVGLNLNCERR